MYLFVRKRTVKAEKRVMTFYKQILILLIPLFPTPGAPTTAIFTSERDDFFLRTWRMPRMALLELIVDHRNILSLFVHLAHIHFTDFSIFYDARKLTITKAGVPIRFFTATKLLFQLGQVVPRSLNAESEEDDMTHTLTFYHHTLTTRPPLSETP